jgi:hypothetical protein
MLKKFPETFQNTSRTVVPSVTVETRNLFEFFTHYGIVTGKLG